MTERQQNHRIAKTIPTISIGLEDGSIHIRSLLNTGEERQLALLIIG